jgi:hypothetical protein
MFCMDHLIVAILWLRCRDDVGGCLKSLSLLQGRLIGRFARLSVSINFAPMRTPLSVFHKWWCHHFSPRHSPASATHFRQPQHTFANHPLTMLSAAIRRTALRSSRRLATAPGTLFNDIDRIENDFQHPSKKDG